MLGKIKVNQSLIGIEYGDKQFIKLAMKGLASQVIDEDIVEFEQSQGVGLVTNIVSRRPQPFIGKVTKVTSKFIYINLPLHSPFSSFSHPNYWKTAVKPEMKMVGWISLETFEVLGFHENLKDLVKSFYQEIQKIDISDISLNQINSKKSNPKDLTHLSTFHIDPSGCVDIDDFMSLDRTQNKIYIHIIDITHYLNLNEKEDLEERKYGYTWYFPDFAFHLHSLNSIFHSKDIFCITLEIDFSEIQIQPKIYSSKINCKYDFTYNQVQEIIDGKINHPIKEDLIWSLDKVQLPKSSPYRRKYWKIRNQKLYPEFEQESLAHRYVSAWMIYYNSWIAEHFSVPQRFHPETKLYQLEKLNELPMEVQYIIYVKQMRQAEYKSESGHFGLEKKFYTHSTSPLRRYFDRLIQYILMGQLMLCPDNLLEHLNRMERLSEKVRDWYDKQLTIQYIQENSEKLWESYVVKKVAQGIEIYIYEIQEFIFMKGNTNFEMGDKIQIKLYVENQQIIGL